jgi:protein phosphatase
MGGHRAGAYASTVAVEYLAGRLHALKASSELPDVLGEANKCIYEAMFSEGGEAGMGTTIVGLWMRGKSITVFNIGDSRAYILRHGSLTQLSVDHTPEGNSDHGYRSHRLTQSLGGTFNRIDPIPHVSTLASEPGDAILLCTDGLTDLVSYQQILSILQKEDGNPAHNLLDAALSAGGRDNITAIFLRLSQ